MNLFERIKNKAKELKNEITVLYYAYQEPNLPIPAKVMVWIALGYALSPIDLIPDFIPILGYLDDLIILPVLIGMAIHLIPKDLLDKARLKAKEYPFILSKNWLFALLFVLIWIILIGTLALSITKLFFK